MEVESENLSLSQINRLFQKGILYGLFLSECKVEQAVQHLQRTPYQMQKTQIYEYYKQFKESEVVVPIIKRRERSQKYTDTQIDEIIDSVKKNRELTLNQIKIDEELNPESLSKQTLLNYFHQRGGKIYSKIQMFSLSEKNIKSRKKFGYLNHKKGQRYWDSVWFSHQSKLNSQKCGTEQVWVFQGEDKLKTEFLKQKSAYNGGLEIQIYGIISVNGPEHLVRYDETLNSEKFQELIQQSLLKNNNFNKENNLLMLDHARIHTSKSTEQFFENNQIQLIEWMDKGADINIIEHVWSQVKDYLYQKQDLIKNKDDVQTMASQYFFGNECKLLITKLYKSIISRVKKLHERKGLWIEVD
ncbi:hypothetical protein ABPG72_014010 [Tetrahymena utriculariae]